MPSRANSYLITMEKPRLESWAANWFVGAPHQPTITLDAKLFNIKSSQFCSVNHYDRVSGGLVMNPTQSDSEITFHRQKIKFTIDLV